MILAIIRPAVRPQGRVAAAALAPLVALLLAGCKGGEEETGKTDRPRQEEPGRQEPAALQHPAAEDTRGPQEPLKQPQPVPPVPRAPVDKLASAVLDFLDAKMARDALADDHSKEGFDRNIRDARHFIPLIREVYAARSYTPLFFDTDGPAPRLTPQGDKLKGLLLDIDSHGLDEEDYALPRLRRALDRLETATQDLTRAPDGLSGKRAAALWQLLQGLTDIPKEEKLKTLLADKGFSDADVKLVDELTRFYPNLTEARKALLDSMQETDVLLLHGFFQFLLDFRYVYRAHPFHPTPEPGLAHVKLRDKLKTDFDQAGPNLADYLERLIPHNPVYQRLKQGLALYRRLAADGRMDKLEIRKSLSRGAKGPEVKRLAERLSLEGYLPADKISERFGDDLQRAVTDYQKTHQLPPTGNVDRLTRNSLNVSMGKRARQVELGLQRWRESDITRDDPPFYIRVNIPQFELEVWENNRLVRRHRVVVGNTSEDVSLEKQEQGRFNHTPLLSKKVTTIVLNPFWYPPPRLQKELLEELRNEPDFFEKYNYEIKMGSDGSEILYQKSGPDNALGVVKFLFPNEYDVYIHDTPKKNLFDRPVRAYSHGCMRLDKPMDLAYYLLEKLNGMTRDDVQEAGKKKDKEKYVKLQTPVPIFVEYCSVSAQENGHVEFFIDIYQYDRAYWDHRLPIELTHALSDDQLDDLSGDDETQPANDAADGADKND